MFTTRLHDDSVAIIDIAEPRPENAAAPEPVAFTAPIAPLRDRVLELSARESPLKIFAFAILAICITALLFAFTSAYWAPAHEGNNQNGYLVGGKLLATHATTGFEPRSPLNFVGWMWVMADQKSTAPGGGMMYPKYPLGVPVLVAIAYKLAGAAHGVDWAYRISPIAMTLAVLAMFFLARPIIGSFGAIMAMLLLAGGQVGMVLTNNPNSHASAMFFVMWGMYFLLLWWRCDKWWQGAIAGFLLGYATTIRYTEGLLLLPLAIIIVMKLRWKIRRSYLRMLVPIGAWILPVLVLVLFNLATVRSPTGYDSTNESTGFSPEGFSEKWSFAVGQLYWTGLYFVLPLAVAGLALAYRWNWRVALVLCAWAVPGAVLYMSYYYGMGMPLLGYLRFFTTVLPPGFLAAAWLLREASLAGPRGVDDVNQYRSVAGPIAVGAFVALVTVTNIKSLVPSLERDQVIAMNLADVGSHIRATAPDGSVVFGQSQRLLNYLQFAGNYDLYGSDYIENGAAVPPIPTGSNDHPAPFQAARREFLTKAYKPLKQRPAMISAVSKICSDALSAKHRVFVVLNTGSAAQWCKVFIDSKQFEATSVREWMEPARMSAEAARSIGALGTMGPGRGGSQRWTIMEIRSK